MYPECSDESRRPRRSYKVHCSQKERRRKENVNKFPEEEVNDFFFQVDPAVQQFCLSNFAETEIT